MFSSFRRVIVRNQQPEIADTSALSAEQLEPRILYSAAPVPVDGGEVDAPAQEAPAGASQTAAVEAPAPVVEAPAAVAAEAVPTESGDGEVTASQEVELVDVDADAAQLNQEVVETLAEEARQRWIDSGISEEQIAALDSIEYRIADVGGAHLGVANGFSITIDDDAGGTGFGNWFIDATPEDDLEFGDTVSAEASGRFDLLSTLIHEQGHVLGLGDVYGERSDVMDGFLDAGTRRLPSTGQAEGAVVGSITGDNYLTANIARASTSGTGVEGNGASNGASLSADGRYVVFTSTSSNLVSGHLGTFHDIFRKDLVTGEILLVSSDSAGNQGNNLSVNASISADGRYVAFLSRATNLVAGDTNSRDDIFVKDMDTGVTTRVSTDSSGVQGNGSANTLPRISGDGEHVVFTSAASNLVADDTNNRFDVFIKNLATGETRRVNTDEDGNQATGGESGWANVSEDGRYVVFHSGAANLVTGDTNGVFDVFRKDMKTGAIVRASTSSAGVQGNTNSLYGTISADGMRVAFESSANTLDPGDTGVGFDVYVKDFGTGETIWVSPDPSGDPANDESTRGFISADGNFVVFESLASNLDGESEDLNGVKDIFVRDLVAEATTLVSTNNWGDEGDGASSLGSMSADGRFIVFDSLATDLVVGDGNGVSDVFVKGVGSLTRDFTTSLEIDSSGNLEIADIDGEDTDDRLTIEVVDGRLEITDSKNLIGSSIVGSTLIGTKGRGISIDLASFSGDIFLDSYGGDDHITVGDLAGLPGGISITGGDGHDEIIQDGVVTLTGASELSYQAGEIRLESGSSITTDTGGIFLSGNASAAASGRWTGLWANRATLMTNSGAIQLDGRGGETGSSNIGIQLRDTDLTSTSGNISITGDAGNSTGSSGKGVVLGRGTDISTAGAGTIFVYGGGGGAMSSGLRGVLIQSGATLTTVDGDLTVQADTGGGTSSTIGVEIQKATLMTTGDGAISINGDTQATKSNNIGLKLRGATISAGGAGNIDLYGFGAAAATGSGNRGIDSNAALITAVDGAISAVALGGSGTSSNTAYKDSKSVVESQNSTLTIQATASTATTRGGNRGGDFRNSSFTGTEVTIVTIGGAGSSNNQSLRMRGGSVTATVGTIATQNTAISTTTGSGNTGTHLSNVTFDAANRVFLQGFSNSGTSRNAAFYASRSTFLGGSGDVTIVGIAKTDTTKSSNYGIYLSNSDLLGTAVVFSGVGGGGTSSNFGMRARGGTITADTGSIILNAVAQATTTSSNNYGASLKSTELTGTTGLTLNGTGGGGTSNNFGLEISVPKADGGAGAISLVGTTAVNTTSNNNRGIHVRNTDLLGVSVSMIGIGGGGKSNNQGIFVDRGSMTASNGVMNLTGNAQAGTERTRNNGIYLRNVDIDSASTITLAGTGGGGTNSNDGVYLSGVNSSNDGGITITGTANAGTTGKDNRGVFLNNTDFATDGNITVEGDGGGGTRNNQGVRIVKGSIAGGFGDLYIAGAARSGTLDKLNIGTYIYNGVVLAGGAIDIEGDGGGGLGGQNHGIFMDRNITAIGADADGNAGAGPGSENEAGDFFLPQP